MLADLITMTGVYLFVVVISGLAVLVVKGILVVVGLVLARKVVI